jgi:hypothetical protein
MSAGRKAELDAGVSRWSSVRDGLAVSLPTEGTATVSRFGLLSKALRKQATDGSVA